MKDLRSRFGLHTLPFTKEIAVRDFFSLPIFDEALQGLMYAIEYRMSAAIIAPAGVGKSCILRALKNRLPEARYRTNYIKVTELSKRDMCREITEVIGCGQAGTYPGLIRRLQERFLQNADIDGLRPVLLIDEAHGLRLDVLSMLRVLANFDMDSRLVLSIIICGQPSLKKFLRRSDMEDVARRLAYYATLRPLTREESVKYIEHRCAIAGAALSLFDSGSQDALFEIARGNMRAIDTLALKSLHIAHENNCAAVDSNHVVEARRYLWP